MRKKFVSALFLAAPAFLFAAGEYKFVDKPFVNALDYFFGAVAYYECYALKIGKALIMLSLCWNAVQMLFGTAEWRKVAVGVVTRLLMFYAILQFYEPATSWLRAASSKIGQNVGFGKEKINGALTEYMGLLQSQVKKSDDKLANEISALQIDIDAMKSDAKFTSKLGPRGAERTAMEIAAKQMRKQSLEKQKELQEKNPDGKRRRLKAIKEFMGAENGDLQGKFAFDLDLKYGDSDLGFLSPNAVVRLALFMINIIITTPDVRIDSETGEMVEVKRSANPFSKDTIFSMGYICEKILCAFTCVFLLICTVFALIQYCMTAIEFAVAQGFCVILVPMLLFEGTRSFADNIMKVFFALSVKLILVTEGLMFMMVSYMQLTSDVVGATNFDWTSVCYIVFTSILCFMACQYAPQIAQTVITGNPQLSMGEFVKSAMTAAAASQAIGRAGVEGGKAIVQGGVNVADFAAGAKTAREQGGMRGLGNYAAKSLKSGAWGALNRAADFGHAVLTPNGVRSMVMGTGQTAQQRRMENERAAQFARGVFDKGADGNRLGISGAKRAINMGRLSGLDSAGEAQRAFADRGDVAQRQIDAEDGGKTAESGEVAAKEEKEAKA